MKLKWEGREALVHIKPVNELKEWIPYFKRVPFSLHNGGINKYLDMIIRQALSTDGEYAKDRQDIPVCNATKQFHLFQHRDVFKALVDALGLYVTDIQSQEATLKITEYGESMWVSFTLANYQLNQAEQSPFMLEVSGLNTVKAGKALDIRLSWYEPRYETRFPYGMLSSQEVNFKKIKRKKAKESDSDIFAQDIYYFLLRHLDHISGERELYKRWIAAEVSQNTLARWIDTTVQDKWNYQLAARAYSIAINGYDIQVKNSEEITDIDQDTEKRKKIPPSELTRYFSDPHYYVQADQAPEKFAPVKNAFDVSLVLGWVLSRQSAIPNQLRWVDIPELMEKLVAADESLRFLFPKSQSSLFD